MGKYVTDIYGLAVTCCLCNRQDVTRAVYYDRDDAYQELKEKGWLIGKYYEWDEQRLCNVIGSNEYAICPTCYQKMVEMMPTDLRQMAAFLVTTKVRWLEMNDKEK